MPTILVAEDSGFTRRLLVSPLREAGYTVLEAENGKQALEIYQAQLPDCVITDVLMPVMDGYEATAALREGGYQGQIIALTAHAMPGDREKCISAGCDGFATKPFARAELVQIVLDHVSKSKDTKLA